MDVPLAQIHFVDIAAQLAFSSPNQMERKLITLHLLGIHFPRSNYVSKYSLEWDSHQLISAR